MAEKKELNHHLKSLFISHGGGPMPLLGDAGHQELVNCLKTITANIPRPDAIIVASAHWEEQVVTITAAKNPPLIYDYYGFSKASYDIQYPCPGEPSLAQEIFDVLQNSGLEARLDYTRGFDHGTFVPLKIMYPEADIPCVQISLLVSLDPTKHLVIGKALRALRRKNILLIGSGFSFHNTPEFFAPETTASQKKNQDFELWLQDTCSNTVLSEEERSQMFIRWSDAPGAHFCHPREEHLLPLHVCYGAAQAPCSESYSFRVLNKQSSMYLWSNEVEQE